MKCTRLKKKSRANNTSVSIIFVEFRNFREKLKKHFIKNYNFCHNRLKNESIVFLHLRLPFLMKNDILK